MMKKTLILAFIFTCCQQLSVIGQNKQETIKDTENYIPLTEERFNEIHDLLVKFPELNPILIEQVPREERIKFYLKSYNDGIISTYMDFAYKRMVKLDQLVLGSNQEKRFLELMKLEQNRANAFQFMTIMTDEQITAVGF